MISRESIIIGVLLVIAVISFTYGTKAFFLVRESKKIAKLRKNQNQELTQEIEKLKQELKKEKTHIEAMKMAHVFDIMAKPYETKKLEAKDITLVEKLIKQYNNFSENEKIYIMTDLYAVREKIEEWKKQNFN